MLYLNTKFPRTKKAYEKAVEDNPDKLKEIMTRLTIQEQQPEPVLQRKVGGLPWLSEGRGSKKRAKTFRL